MIPKEKKERDNKFDAAIADLDKQEEEEQGKPDKVLNSLNGNSSRKKTITDKNGRVRVVKVREKRKTLPVYIPLTLYEQFDAINDAKDKSNNSAIVDLIREYVNGHKEK